MQKRTLGGQKNAENIQCTPLLRVVLSNFFVSLTEKVLEMKLLFRERERERETSAKCYQAIMPKRTLGGPKTADNVLCTPPLRVVYAVFSSHLRKMYEREGGTGRKIPKKHAFPQSVKISLCINLES